MDIKKKLRDFEGSCLDMAAVEAGELKKEIEQEIEEQIKSEIDEYIKRKDWNFNKTIQKFEKNYMKEIFNCQNICKKEILKAKKDIDIDLKQEVSLKLKKFCNTNKYKSFLFNRIDSVIELAKNESDICICLVPQDIEKYRDEILQKYNCELEEMDESFIGGCVLKTNQIVIDNSLKNSVEENMQE